MKDNHQKRNRKRDARGGSAELAWERGSGEGAAAALDRLKKLEKIRSKIKPISDERPSYADRF